MKDEEIKMAIKKILANNRPVSVSFHPSSYFKVGFEFASGVFVAIGAALILGKLINYVLGLI